MKERAKQSAGVLLFRRKAGSLEVFLVHMGGPFWQHKDEGAWSIPKGEFEEGEAPLEAAKREFEEETGIMPQGEFVELKPVKQRRRFGSPMTSRRSSRMFCIASRGRVFDLRGAWPDSIFSNGCRRRRRIRILPLYLARLMWLTFTVDRSASGATPALTGPR